MLRRLTHALPFPSSACQQLTDYARFALCGLLLSAIPVKHAVAANQQNQAHIATTLPVTDLLARALLQETPIQTDYLPAKRYPVKRIGYWLQKKLPEKASGLPQYTAVINVASVWPALRVYPTLRSHNIRIVPVDAAIQLKPEGARVSRQQSAESGLDYFWLSPANLKVMNRIIAEDLVRLWPNYQSQITRNQQNNDQAISQFALQLDDMLWQQQWDGLCTTQPELNPLLYTLSLPVLDAEENDSSMRCLWLSDKSGQSDTAHPKTRWQLNSLNKVYSGSFEHWLKANLDALKSNDSTL